MHATTPPPAQPAPPRARTLDEANARLAAQDREIRQLRAERSAIFQALRNPHLKAQERITGLVAICHLGEQRSKGREHDDGYRTPLAAIGAGAGCSPKRASAHLATLASTGLFEKRVAQNVTRAIDPETGEVDRRNISELYLRPDPAADTLALIRALAAAQPAEARPQGGRRTKRPTCPEHPDAGTIERWTIHCAACDRPLDAGERYRQPDAPDDESEAGDEQPATIRPEDEAAAPATAGGPSWDTKVKTKEGGGGTPRAAARGPARVAGGAPSPASAPAAPAAAPPRSPTVADPNGLPAASLETGAARAPNLTAQPPAADGRVPLAPPGRRPADAELIARLAHLAGDRARHLVMPPVGPHKYVWRDGPADRATLAAHLRGEVTVGAELCWAAGVTFAVCWDADHPADFARLRDAARTLRDGGARPVLERSPTAGAHAGGGRLWLFFPTPVEAGRAWATAVAQAPALAAVPEFWPTLHLRPEDRGQAVRLPGGFYRREPGAGWCALAEFADAPLWVVGREAAALTLSATTPAGWVTAPAPPPPARGALPAGAPPALDCGLIPPDGAHPPPAGWSDPVWLPKYGAAKEVLPFAITDKEAIAWCNARHDVRTLLPKEANGYARAVWRAERTPSIGYLPNNQWVDFGAGGRRPDGRRDGGDAFAALCRLRGLDRPAALREIVVAMRAEAAAELDAAARAGRGVPAWVAAITAPAGWRRYDRLREASTRGGDGGAM